MATTDERKALRETLIESGFTRITCTYDDGNGVYSETFKIGSNVVTLDWGPKTEHKEFVPPAKRGARCRLCAQPWGYYHVETCRHSGLVVGDAVR